MNIQHIHSQIISCKIHRLENLFQSHFFLVFGQANHRIRLGLQSLFNETQKVFLVHTRGRVDVRVHLHKKNETIESLFLTERLESTCVPFWHYRNHDGPQPFVPPTLAIRWVRHAVEIWKRDTKVGDSKMTSRVHRLSKRTSSAYLSHKCRGQDIHSRGVDPPQHRQNCERLETRHWPSWSHDLWGPEGIRNPRDRCCF